MSKITGYSYVRQPFDIDPVTKKIIYCYRPMISIRISIGHGQISFPFDALIDSGSDRNLFPLRFATAVGIKFKKVKPKQIMGIGKVIIDAYTARINIWVGTKKYSTEVDFSPQQHTSLTQTQKITV